MAETNGQRLEELKYKKMIAERSISKQAVVSLDALKWAIQQAERVEGLEAKNRQRRNRIKQLEMKYENTGSVMARQTMTLQINEIQEENARLREALKEISEIKGYYQNDVLQGIARQVLEDKTT